MPANASLIVLCQIKQININSVLLTLKNSPDWWIGIEVSSVNIIDCCKVLHVGYVQVDGYQIPDTEIFSG